MAVEYKALEAEFGFKSPFFSVDEQGNVTLRSITYIVPPEETVNLTPDYNVNETNGAFYITQLSQENPTIDLIRGNTYVFQLNLSTISFNLFADGVFYTSGVSYTTDGVDFLYDVATQNKTTGFIIFEVPANAPDTIIVGNLTQSVTFTLAITNPVYTGNGNFNNLTTTGNVNLIGDGSDITIAPTGNGTLIISPPSGSVSNMNIAAKTLSASDTVTLTPVSRNITIAPLLSGKLIIDSGTKGSINNMDIGTSVPAAGTFSNVSATSGTLNNVVIGNIVPTSGNFTSLSIQDSPVNTTDVANKQYVDSSALTFAIAFGL
jgi:hypothetical protein